MRHLLFFTLATCYRLLATTAKPPNFLFIVADLGYGPCHKAENQFYKDLQALPPNTPR